MVEIPEAPYQANRPLLTGHFRETSGYRAVRRQGVSDWLLIHTLSGRGRFGYAGGELIAEPGDWILLRPGTPHDYGVEPSLQRWELLWAHFQPRSDWLDWLAWPSRADGLLRLRISGPVGDSLAQQFTEVHRLLGSQQKRSEALAANALEKLLLGCDASRADETIDNRPGDARIRRAMDHIERHLADRLPIDDIAAAVNLSPSRLAHIFKQETGQSVQVHIETRRMQLAADLLRRTGFPIKQIAASAGFESQFYFSQRFSRWAGMSPMQYRQNSPAIRD